MRYPLEVVARVRDVIGPGLALGVRMVADDSLYRSLKGSVAELHRIGDCVAPRTTDAAIFEGAASAASSDQGVAPSYSG